MANAYNEKTIKNDTDYVLVTESTGGIFRVSLLDLIGDLASNENVTMIQMALANKWGVEIAEDVAGRKYASGFSLLLHPIWLNGQAYIVGDTVAVDASVYRCTVSHTADATNSPTGATGTTYWLLLPEGVKSSFIVRADRFAVMGPDGSGDALMPFTVDIVDGKATVGVHGQIIVGGSLPFNALSDEAQTAINNSISVAEAQALADAQTYADGKFVTQVLHQEDIDNLQSQLDGQVVAWFYDYEPTTANAPASLWTTEALKDEHANDTFTHLTTGQSWRWVYDAGVWKWLEIADTVATAALALAAQAKDTADGKRRVFVAQPTVPYDEGDLWADGTTLLRCVTPKTSTGSYAAGDWVAVATKAPQLPPDVDLFAHWDFDDTLLDRVSLLTTTQYGTGGYVGGISGRGRNFVYATKDYLKIPAGAMAGIANGTGFTLSLWFKADANQMYTNPRIFTIAETGLNFTLGLQGTAPSPLYPVVRYAGVVKYSPVAVSQGEWHHIVVRVNSLTAMDVTLWLDGVLCTNWVTGGITGNAIFNAIGGYDGTGYGWTGAIDEVRVYNTKTITDDHVRALYLNPGGSSKNVAPDVDKTDYVTIYANTETFPAVLTPDVMKRTGSTFEKIGGVAGWNAQAYSLQGYTGGCRLAFKAGSTTFNFVAGINTDPATDASYASVDYQFYIQSNRTVAIYEGLNPYGIGSPPYTTNTLFEIIYDGSEIRYLIDGVAVRTVAGLEAGLTFYMDLSFSSIGSKATHVQWGPFAPPLSVVKALALVAETEAKSFADGIVTAEEQRAIADAQAKANAAQAAAEGNAETFPVAITPDLMIRRGSTFERVAGSTGWLAQAYSANKYTGGCRVAFRAGSVDKGMALGINADPTLNTSYASIDYCFYLQSNGLVAIYESGTARAIGTPPYTTNTLFEIIYDGAEVRYLMDGVVVRTVTGLANNLTFYMDSAFYIIGGKFTHVEWGSNNPTLSVTQTLASNAEANAKSYVDGNFVTKVLHQTDIGNLQNQVDGQVSAWFYSYAPTTANAPASSWTTVALKELHADDTFTHLITGQSWRWVNTAGVWGWTEIADTATVKALAEARVAKDTADNKRRVFVNQPTVPYDIGDLWTTGSIISRCVTAKTTAGSYAAGDWVAVADATNYDDYRVSNVKTENSVITIARPVGGTYYNSGLSVTGAIKITLPQSWSSTMMKFEVDVRQYSTTKSFTLQLGGYSYTTNSKWLNSFAQLTGSTASNNRVRFGHDGSKCCILIGDVTSVWNNPSIVVKDFQASYLNYTRDKWETGWAISIVTSDSGITTTVDITDTLIDAKSILGQGALATQSTADYGTQVTGTKPPANADSTTTVIGEGLITTGFIGNKRKTDPLLTLGINFDTAEILVGAAAGLKIKSGGGILIEGGGGITVNSGGGITVKDGGALSMEAGGDLILTADSTNPSKIQFKRTPDDTNPVLIYGSVDNQYLPFLAITPTLGDSSILYLGTESSRFGAAYINAPSVRISAAPYGIPAQVGIIVAGENAGADGGLVIVEARQSLLVWGSCKCYGMSDSGSVALDSSHNTYVKSYANVKIEAPDITITGSTTRGVPIYAPYRATEPTTAELPNDHYMIYRTSATGIRLTMNCNGNIQTRHIL